MMNIKLEIAYDGSKFHGFQIQKNAHTIEAEITKALNILTFEEIKIVGCGRTDTGVHAYHYVINFKTNSKIPPDKFILALNSQIDPSIAVLTASYVSDEFHSRFDILEKTYVYKIHHSKIRDPFKDKYVYRYGGKIDVSKMQEASNFFVGTHDFGSHKSQGTPTKDDIRTIYDLKVTKNDDIIEIEMTANGFLYNMARTIAGTLLDCGINKISPSKVSDILESKDRKNAGMTLPAKGLFMKHTKYKG